MVKFKVNLTFVHWLTLAAFLVSLFSWFIFVKGVNTSGDTGIAMWAIFMFTFVLVSAPIHLLLLLLAVIQLFIGDRQDFKWVYTYLILTIVGHLVVANQYGAFAVNPNDPPQLSSHEILMQRAFNGGNNIDVVKIQQALKQGNHANGGFLQGKLPYLVTAAVYANVPSIQVLLAAGADPNKRTSIEYSTDFDLNFINASPLDVVGFADHGDVLKSVQVLVAAGANSKGALLALAACRKGDLALFNYANALNAGIKVDGNIVLDAKGRNCLHHIAETNQQAFLQTLLSTDQAHSLGLQPLLSVASKNNQFPLDTALVKKHYAIALIILKAGGSVNQKWSEKRILRFSSEEPAIEELKALLLKALQQNEQDKI